MLQRAISLLFPVLPLILSLITVSTANSNIYIDCSPISFASMTPYELNVNSLFSSLADSASLSNFNKFEISPPGNSQCDDVYGLFQCQGDLNSTACKDCVADSLSQLKTTCPVSTGGTIQLEECLVKYDNTSFFGIEDKMEASRKCGPSHGSNSDVLSNIDNVLANLISENNQYFRKGDFGSIQGVAQCVQDLSASDCQDCLLEASGRLRSECEASTWGSMYLGKCYIKYATHNGNNENNCNNCCNQKSGVLDILTALSAFVSAFLSAFVSYYISNKSAKKVKDTIYRVKIESNDTKEEVKKVAKDVEVQKQNNHRIMKELAEAKMPQMPTPGSRPYPYGPYLHSAPDNPY